MKKETDTSPDYKKIYTDIIAMKYPEKKESCKSLLIKDRLSVIDILELNKRIFGMQNETRERDNQKHRSYNKNDIFRILEYQKKNMLNNTQVARHFKLSRNTVAKWKKIFQV